MGKTIDKLWELIKALSISEKRYFKIYASKHTTANKNNYIRLFDVLNKQEVYDEATIRTCFEGEAFLKQLDVTKHYLRQLILKSLRSFHAEKSVNSKIFSYFQDIELLFKKGLISQCKQQINKAKAYMESQDKTLDLFRLAQWENEVDNELNKYTGNELLTTSLEKNQNLLKQITNLSEYINLRKVVHFFFRKKVSWGSDYWMERIQKHLEHPLLQDEKKALTFRAKLIYYEIHSLCNQCTYNWGELEKNSQLGLELLDTQPKYRENNIHAYLKFMARYCYVLNKDPNKIDLFFENLDKLKGLTIKERPLRLKAELLYYNCLSRLCIDSGNQKEAPILAQKIENWLSDNHRLKDDYKLILLANLGDLYFIINDFEKVLNYLNILFNLKGFNLQHNVQQSIRLRLLIVYIELGYFDLLKPAIRSFFRFLAKEEAGYKVEILFVQFIQDEFSQHISSLNIKEKCTEFLELIKPMINETPHEWIIFITTWLKSKSRGVALAEIFKQKYFSKELIREKIK